MQREYQNPRKPIRAQTVNYGVEARIILDGITASPGLDIAKGKNGMVLSLATTPVATAVGIASGTITARSGGTAGTGSCTMTSLQYSGSDFVYVSMGFTVAVANPYSASISNGTYVTLVTNNGIWQVDGADCP